MSHNVRRPGAGFKFGLTLFALLALGCAREPVCEPYDFHLPVGFAAPPHPPDVCLTPARVELGRRLFYSKDLSRDQDMSCSTCHRQELAFTDGRPRAVGRRGMIHPRNTQGLSGVGYFTELTWLNPELHRLDNQALLPFFAENTDITVEELFINGLEYRVTERLLSDGRYAALFALAFPDEPIDMTRVARALAAFQATLVSARSPFDRGTLDDSAKRGKDLFYSERAGCFRCHGGPNFNLDENGRMVFANIGLYNVNGKGDYPDRNLHGPAALRRGQGVHLITGRPEDRGKFRAPSLRNVALTGPYMHDGSVSTLEEAVDLIDAGGRNVVEGPFAGDGRENPNKDPRIRPLHLSVREKQDLAAFLRSLTDECFVNDPNQSDPSAPPPVQPPECK